MQRRNVGLWVLAGVSFVGVAYGAYRWFGTPAAKPGDGSATPAASSPSGPGSSRPSSGAVSGSGTATLPPGPSGGIVPPPGAGPIGVPPAAQGSGASSVQSLGLERRKEFGKIEAERREEQGKVGAERAKRREARKKQKARAEAERMRAFGAPHAAPQGSPPLPDIGVRTGVDVRPPGE